MSDKAERILRMGKVLDRTGLSRSALYRKMADGSFPRNVKISQRSMGWFESAIDTWVHNRRFYRVEDFPRR